MRQLILNQHSNTGDLIYINDINLVIKHCKIHHFADDTNLLNITQSPQYLNKLITIEI